MSELSSTSCNRNDSCGCGGCDTECGLSPILMILLLTMCNGDGGGLFGGCGSNNSCGCNNGLGGMLPLILILCLCGGSF